MNQSLTSAVLSLMLSITLFGNQMLRGFGVLALYDTFTLSNIAFSDSRSTELIKIVVIMLVFKLLFVFVGTNIHTLSKVYKYFVTFSTIF